MNARADSIAPILVEPRLAGGRGHYAELARAIVAGLSDRAEEVEIVSAPGAAATCGGLAPDGGRPRIAWQERPLVSALAEVETLRRSDPRCRPLLLTARGIHAAACSMPGSSGDALERSAILFHWRPGDLLDRVLHRAAASARRRVLALATTEEVAASLRALGWRRVRAIDYPILAPPPPAAAPWSHVLMAGSLRFNKGLASLVALAERWSRDRAEIPLLVQSSTKHAGRHGRREAPLLARLERSGHRGLRCDPAPLDRAAYLGNFRGAITLVAYDPATFAGQVSGVALDAVLSGSPIVASEGTEPASLVREFGAGEVVAFGDADALDRAIRRLIERWEDASAAARRAAAVLAARHDPRRFVEAWLSGVGGLKPRASSDPRRRSTAAR